MSLVFLCCTNLDVDVQVLNYADQSKAIENFQHLKPKNLGDMLLDPKTGDLYAHNARHATWEPRFNVGFHFQSLNSRDEVAKRIISRPRFRVTEVDKGYDSYKSSGFETRCFIERSSVNHYLFQNIENHFLVANPSGWKTHPFLLMAEDKKIKILAESEAAYQIFEIGYAVGILFDMNQKDKTHSQIISNFTREMIEITRSLNYKTQSLLDMIYNKNKNNQTIRDETWKAHYDLYVQRLKSEVEKSTDLSNIKSFNTDFDNEKHSGMAYRKDKMMKTTAQNSIRKVPIEKEQIIPSLDPFARETDRRVKRENSRIFKKKIREIYDNVLSKEEHNKSWIMSQEKKEETKTDEPDGDWKINLPNSEIVLKTDTSNERSQIKKRNEQMDHIDENSYPLQSIRNDSIEDGLKGNYQPIPQISFRNSLRLDQEYYSRLKQIRPPLKKGGDGSSAYEPVVHQLVRGSSSNTFGDDNSTQNDLNSMKALSKQGSMYQQPQGLKVLIRMKPNDLNLVQPKINSGLNRSTSKSQRQGDKRSTSYNADVKVIQVPWGADDRSKFYLPKTRLKREVTEEDLKKRNRSFQF